MLDLSPEKLMMLLAIGLVVLGPDKLPAAARGLAGGLVRARRLAATLTEPITTTLVEPLKANLTEPLTSGIGDPRTVGLYQPRPDGNQAVADLRATIANHPLLGPAEATARPVEPTLN